MLRVRNLRRLSIGPIDLDIAPGERVSLQGPSGAGKSMLLRAIADLDPHDGSATLNDDDRSAMNAPDWRRRVMYIPAHSGWWEDDVGSHFAGLKREDVKGILHKLGMESTALGWKVANLSTGERQRLALARAIAHDPDVLLLDEPTSGLDPDNVCRTEKVLETLGQSGKAIAFVSHDPEQAKRFGTRHLKLENGKLAEVSP